MGFWSGALAAKGGSVFQIPVCGAASSFELFTRGGASLTPGYKPVIPPG